VDTTVGYLLGESSQTNVLKDPTMLLRLNEINELPAKDRECILYTLDGLLQNVRTKKAFATAKGKKPGQPGFFFFDVLLLASNFFSA
jgi:hypothetical protein